MLNRSSIRQPPPSQRKKKSPFPQASTQLIPASCGYWPDPTVSKTPAAGSRSPIHDMESIFAFEARSTKTLFGLPQSHTTKELSTRLHVGSYIYLFLFLLHLPLCAATLLWASGWAGRLEVAFEGSVAPPKIAEWPEQEGRRSCRGRRNAWEARTRARTHAGLAS